ncbi:hypothetical protein SASPL_131328 [Salvia splendens]|uniref:SWI/SNF related-matrix-associated actin-dependent regulator of chromatin subfamily C n=1 Tax=Salvia splendens TaxID=180675 RepID=A0A8X8X7N4_SALSN|nr:hypothetical protein SASPL_131328 [Salvia splendens]
MPASSSDLDPPQNHLESEDDPQIHTSDRKTQITGEKGDEKLVAGGLKLCEFPVAIKREINMPHSSVFRIVEFERAARYGDSIGLGQSGVPVLENISYGQLQALSAVPRDNPALLGVPSEETASACGGGSYVITPPRIVAGGGVTKRLGSAGRVHVVPVHSEWFSPNSVHRLERQVVPHFFSGKSSEHTPEKYMECRNFIVAMYMENPEKHLAVANCQGLEAGIDNEDLTRIVRFLDHWGIINYCATPPKHEAPKGGTYLCEDSNNELHVPLSALKSIESLIKFDKPKCRLKATDVYPELACQQEEDSDIDSAIREKLSEHQCNCCSRPIPAVYYQSQKEVDAGLCLDCYHEAGFIAGHSSLDFMKENSTKDYGDLDGDSWSDQEALLLLEGMQLYNENWNKIAEHVGSKSKAQCILHFVRLPLDGAPLDSIDVPSTSDLSNLSNHERSEPISNGICLEGEDTESKFPFSSSGNPVMSLVRTEFSVDFYVMVMETSKIHLNLFLEISQLCTVAFLASALGPRVAAACAHASLGSLSMESSKEGSPGGSLSQHDAEGATLSAEKVISAAEDGLAAAAMKAKLFADHEEREIQRLSANIINHQLKRLELKLKQFAEFETLLMRECEQMERTRQRIAAEQALVMSGQFGSAGVQRPMGLPGVSNCNSAMNNYAGNRQHIQGSQQPFVSGYGNNQPIHPHMSLMQQQQQQQQQQQGMYGLGPRLPLSAIHPSSSAPNTMFNPTSNSQPSLGYPMLRPLSGTKSGLG